jgi:hypothetical protein
MCGDIIVEKLVDKSGMYSYPEQNENGDFSYGGIKFIMKNVQVGGGTND